MRRVAVVTNSLVLLALVWLGSGCGLVSNNPLEEQRDPHYLTGKNRVSSLDYQGAVEAFEKALETNPKSASAHFELGFIYAQRLTNYASAIYHFERYLTLRPKSDLADVIRGHITACTQEMARKVPLGPVTPAMQRSLDRLAEENLRLRQQLDFLSRRLAEATNALQFGAAPIGTLPSAPLTYTNTAQVAPVIPAATNRFYASPAIPPQKMVRQTTPTPTRTHVVQRNETMVQIARRYRISLGALQAANPRIQPRQLRVGQTLVIPSP
jgi:tetratricopeptide (TPR) repeat protein